MRSATLLLLALLAALTGGLPTSLRSYPSVPVAFAEDDDDDDDDGEDDDDDDDEDEDEDDDDAPAPDPEFVILLPPGASLVEIEGLGYTVVESQEIALVDGTLARLEGPPGLSVEAARTAIVAAVDGAVVDGNTLYRPQELPCGADGCAAFPLIGWDPQPACGAAPRIGLVDTGVNLDHSGFTPGNVTTVQVIAADRQPASDVHGTAIALLMAGRAEGRTPGLLPQARIVAAEAFHRDAAGADAADAYDLVRALDRLSSEDLDAINMSFTGAANELLARAVAALGTRGIPLVAAVGNDGPFAPPLYPAAYPETIGVTAIDRERQVYRQANAGEHVDFAAPGVNLWTAASIEGGRFRSGTSYAAPFVTAALALARIQTPDESVEALTAALSGRVEDLGAAGKDETFGHGLLRMPACTGPSPEGAATGAATSEEALPAEPEGPL